MLLFKPVCGTSVNAYLNVEGKMNTDPVNTVEYSVKQKSMLLPLLTTYLLYSQHTFNLLSLNEVG